MKRGGKRLCEKGKPCGATCISRRKVCQVEVGREIAREIPRAANAVNRRGMTVAQEIQYLENKRSSLVDRVHDLLSKDRGDGKGSHFDHPDAETFKILRKFQRDTERYDARLNRLEGRPLRVLRGPDGKEVKYEPKRWYPDRFNLDERFKKYKSEGREKYLAKIMQDFLDKGVKGDPPQAIFMMGGPGSGKTTLLASLMKGKSGFVHIDPDAIKALLPEYLFGVGMGYQGIANTVNSSSGSLSTKMAKAARKGGLNYIWDGTGANRNMYEEQVRELRKAGYNNLQLVAQHVPLREGVRRAIERSEFPISMGGGRFVPLQFIEGAYEKVPLNFIPLAKLFDSASITDGMTGDEIMRYRGGRVVSEDPETAPDFRRQFGGEG